MKNGDVSRMTDDALVEGGIPRDNGNDVLLQGWEGHLRVEWGPYLGYGGGSGV